MSALSGGGGQLCYFRIGDGVLEGMSGNYTYYGEAMCVCAEHPLPGGCRSGSALLALPQSPGSAGWVRKAARAVGGTGAMERTQHSSPVLFLVLLLPCPQTMAKECWC